MRIGQCTILLQDVAIAVYHSEFGVGTADVNADCVVFHDVDP
jgi:hypothetical protein